MQLRTIIAVSKPVEVVQKDAIVRGKLTISSSKAAVLIFFWMFFSAAERKDQMKNVPVVQIPSAIGRMHPKSSMITVWTELDLYVCMSVLACNLGCLLSLAYMPIHTLRAKRYMSKRFDRHLKQGLFTRVYENVNECLRRKG